MNLNSPLRVAIVGANLFYRTGIAQAIQGDFIVIVDLPACAQVIILDADGVARQSLPRHARVIALAEPDSSPSGAIMVLPKSIHAHELRDALERVCDPGAREKFDALSRRESEILRQVSTGKSNKEVAYSLRVKEKTVKNHMTAILKKLGKANRTQAVMCAYAHGWLA
jgi:DNA-binding NarL/FixJ family response regulator